MIATCGCYAKSVVGIVFKRTKTFFLNVLCVGFSSSLSSRFLGLLHFERENDCSFERKSHIYCFEEDFRFKFRSIVVPPFPVKTVFNHIKSAH